MASAVKNCQAREQQKRDTPQSRLSPSSSSQTKGHSFQSPSLMPQSRLRNKSLFSLSHLLLSLRASNTPTPSQYIEPYYFSSIPDSVASLGGSREHATKLMFAIFKKSGKSPKSFVTSCEQIFCQLFKTDGCKSSNTESKTFKIKNKILANYST